MRCFSKRLPAGFTEPERHPVSAAMCAGDSRDFRSVQLAVARYAASIWFVLSGFATCCMAQLSSSSWWPKFQRDAQNTGRVPVLGIAADVHVTGFIRLGAPVAAENHATPVFSADNARIYIGGANSTLHAIDLESMTVVWSLMLGDGTGHIYHTAAVGEDGSIYVAAWDNVPPYDGLAKVRDEGAHGVLVWSIPFRRVLASPTIAPDGMIVVGGRHDTQGWGYFGLRDLGAGYDLAWSAALRSDPNNPASTGNIGSSPALSVDGRFLYGGSDQNRSFWRVVVEDGAEVARIPLTQYCWASAPLVSPGGHVIIGEGMSFSSPNANTEGKIYAISPDAAGNEGIIASLPLRNGHLNGGAAALGYRENDGIHRLYVAANGYGHATAGLIAVDFDPAGATREPPVEILREAWRVPIGPGALCYPTCVTTRDQAVFVIGPADHVLYGLRDSGASGHMMWTLALSQITQVAGWSIGNQRGPQSAVISPDGRILWNAPDGYLYVIAGWISGDMNGDEVVDATDVSLLTWMLDDRAEFELRYPEVPADLVGDLNGDGILDAADLGMLTSLIAP